MNLQARAFKMNSLNYAPHWHVDLEIVYVLDGELKAGLDDKEFTLQAGDLFVASSKQMHSYSSTDAKLDFIIAMFNPMLIGLPDGWPTFGKLRSEPIFNNKVESIEEKKALASIKELLTSMENETVNFNSTSTSFMYSHMYGIVGMLQRHFSQSNNFNKASTVKDSKDIQLIYAILNHIDKNYIKELNLTEVAKQFNISSAYLSRLFKKSTGINFSDYLVEIRLQQAKALLLRSDNSIVNIAYECGFQNLRTFNRLFKKSTEITPSEYRKGHINYSEE